MMYAIFSIIVLAASILGAMAGIGGGVIIRPALDAFNYFDNSVITNMLSAFCVLAVALTSVIKHLINKTKFKSLSTVYLGIGAVIGGVLGQFLFNIVKNNSNKQILIIVQSICLIVLLIFVIIYMLGMKGKDKYTLHIKNWLITIGIGLFLGLSSSFLGIGGGPINVAVLCLFFGMDMKLASVNSLVIIIFSQSSKIIQSLIQNQLQTCNMDWTLLIILVCVAVVGSLIGTFLNKKVPEKALLYVYIVTMFGIIGINVYNIVINSIALV